MQVAQRAHPGVVDQYVDLPVRGEHPLDQGGAFGGDGDVADLGAHTRVLRGQLLQRGCVPGDTDNGVTEPGEMQRALPPDPRGGTGDEDDPGTGRREDHVVDIPFEPRLKQV